MAKLIKLGICEKAHGVKGGFTFKLFDVEQCELEQESNIVLKPIKTGSCLNEDGETFSISQISFGNKVICYLKDVVDRNRVEELLPFSIHRENSQLEHLKSGEYLPEDLVGFDVYDHISEQKWSRVDSIYETPVQSIVVFENGIELPLVDQFFVDVDTENKKIRLRLPETIE